MSTKIEPKISMISAIVRKNRTIGKESGGLPWRIKEDFQFFRNTTMNHPIIMGRKTFEEFGGKVLPGRKHIVVTRDEKYSEKIPTEIKNEVVVANSIENAIIIAKEFENSSGKEQKEIFIIGGGQIYLAGLPFADRLYLTLVDTNIDGPVKFPDYKSAGFTKIISSKKSQDENFEYEFVTIERE